MSSDVPTLQKKHSCANITTNLYSQFSTNTIEYTTADVKLKTAETFIEIDDSAAHTKIIDINIDRIRIWSHSKQLHENVQLRKWDKQNWRTRCKSVVRVDESSCERTSASHNGLSNRVIEYNSGFDNIIVWWHTGTKDNELYHVVENSKMECGVEAAVADIAGRDSSGNLSIAEFNYRPPRTHYWIKARATVNFSDALASELKGCFM